MDLAAVMDGLVRFWVADAPPLGGWARIFIYGSLLLLFLPDPRRHPWYRGSYTPLVAPEMRQWTAPAFFQPERFAARIPRRLYEPAVLRWVRAITVAAWIACIAGLGGAVSAWACAAGLVLLWAVTSGCIGTNHRWYFPVYTIVTCALAGAAFGHELSLDAWIAERYPGYWLAPAAPHEAPVAWSGLPRKLVVVTGAALLFLGGVSKLRNSGLRWMDGRTLAFYVGGSSGAWPWLKRKIQASPALAIALSVGTMVLELGCIVVLVAPPLRLPTAIAAIGLHLGIWLTMAPRYFPSLPCYVLWVCWPWEQPASMPAEPGGALVVASLLATAWWGWALYTVLVQRREGWPLSSVPMYSFYRSSGEHSHAWLRDLAQAEHAAREVLRAGCVNVPCWSARWVRVRLAAPGQALQLHAQVTSPRHAHGCHKRQWARMRWNAAAAAIRGETSEARHLLEHVRELAPQWRAELPTWAADPDARIELVLCLREGPRVLASVPWSSEGGAQAEGSDPSDAGALSFGTS